MVLGRLLGQLEPLDPSVAHRPRRLDRVERGGLEPAPAPLAERAAGAVLERGEEVGERRVAPGMAPEVRPQARPERVHPDLGDELLDDRGALSVRDPVEVVEGRVRVGHEAGDGVRRRAGVGLVAPALHVGVEGAPGALEAGGVHEGEVGGVRGEALVEPEVVPPAHRHEVAEPHVGQLVEDRLRPPEALRLGGRVAVDVDLAEGDRADVLHRPRVELRDEDLVVLGEGERLVEERRVVVEALAGDLEDLVGVDEPGKRRPGPDAQRRPPVQCADPDVGPGDDRDQVGRDRRRRPEAMLAAPVGEGHGRGRWAVGDDRPRRPAHGPSRRTCP